MANGNKYNKSGFGVGTDEMLAAYMADTPGELETSYTENVDKMIKIQKIKTDQGKKNHMSNMFDNPLKGYPYNESVQLDELEEEIDALISAEEESNNEIFFEHFTMAEWILKEGSFWGQDKMSARAKAMMPPKTHVRLTREPKDAPGGKGGYERATVSKKDKKKIAQLKKDGYKIDPTFGKD